MKDTFKHIEAYGIVGNLETAALIGNDGSVDWLCFPELGSPSVFAALLDPQKGGFFRIQPVDRFEAYQKYHNRTNVLATTFVTAFGNLMITDFMPVMKNRGQTARRALFRKVECTEDEFKISIRFSPRFHYGRDVPALKRNDRFIVAQAHGVKLFLQTPVPLELRGGNAEGIVELGKTQQLWFILHYGHARFSANSECEKLLTATGRYWAGWERGHEEHKKMFHGPLYDIIVRSGLVLKLLTNPMTGSIAAAATTSLPEVIGGTRNWDYRFAWIRDASFTAQALFHLGHTAEARSFIRWIKAIMDQEKSPAEFQIMYGMHGETDLHERVLENLSGYENSGPVRIGNAASNQRQHDIYGELINAIYETTRYGLRVSHRLWRNISVLVEYVCRIWRQPDSGIWEIRGEPRHYVYSKLMCWVAVDRGIKIAEKKKIRFPRRKWEGTRHEIRDEILKNGYDSQLGSFVRSYGETTLDASCLLIPLMGFLPFADPAVVGTIESIKSRLTVGETFVRRYEAPDGLPGTEGAFLICTFWLIKALILSGRVTEAKRYFSNILGYISPLGLFAEEIDAVTGRQLGNFPQAFSHIGLVNCALYLGIAGGRTPKEAHPIGSPPVS